MCFAITARHQENDERFVLSQFFGDRMVLQADKPVRIWGEYPQDGGVALGIRGENEGEEALFFGEVVNGRFDLIADAFPHGGPYTLRLIAENGGQRRFENVLFGEVFLCAGQSNMGWSMKQCYDGTMDKLRYQKEIDASTNDQIRGFWIFGEAHWEPQEMLPPSGYHRWDAMSPETVLEFGAVPYFFAREMQARCGVPIGFIQCCIGATSVQCWIPPQDMEQFGVTPEDMKKFTPEDKVTSTTPSVWYNGVIHPLRKLAARGILWYQGECNFAGLGATQGVVAHGYRKYGDYLKVIIDSWRREFGRPELPFAIAQLPRYQDEAAYFYAREEDKRVCSLVENTTYSVNIDTGLYPENVAPGDIYNEGHGIHPYDKLKVGVRLAHAFVGAFLGEPGLYQGPVLVKADLGERAPVLTFDRVGTGLTLTGELAGFEIAGPDRVFHPAVPHIVGDDRICLSCDAVIDPIEIRYGFSNYSTLITEPLTDCGQSVCVYNTLNGNAEPAYPAEQFWIRLY